MLGIEYEVRPDADHGDDEVIVLRWLDLTAYRMQSFVTSQTRTQPALP